MNVIFFCLLNADAKRILLYKPHQKAVVCLLYQDTAGKEQKQVEYEVLSWRKDEWRHLAFSWGQGLYTLYIDLQRSTAQSMKCLT